MMAAAGGPGLRLGPGATVQVTAAAAAGAPGRPRSRGPGPGPGGSDHRPGRGSLRLTEAADDAKTRQLEELQVVSTVTVTIITLAACQ